MYITKYENREIAHKINSLNYELLIVSVFDRSVNLAYKIVNYCWVLYEYSCKIIKIVVLVFKTIVNSRKVCC